MSPATNEFGKYSDLPKYGICHTYLIKVHVVINIDIELYYKWCPHWDKILKYIIYDALTVDFI